MIAAWTSGDDSAWIEDQARSDALADADEAVFRALYNARGQEGVDDWYGSPGPPEKDS